MTARNRFAAIAAFERELVVFGLVLPRGGVVSDGRIHRLDDGQHSRKRNGAGWYTLRELPSGLLVGRGGSWWRDRGSFKWNSRGDTKLTPADRKAIAELNGRIKNEKARHYAEGAKRAAQIWGDGKPCSSHPYLEHKRVKSYGLRVDDVGRLLIPLYDLDGNLRGIQRINAKGEKRYTFGTDRERATCFVIGSLDNAANVVVVEGYATGATVHEAMGWPVVVAFDAGGVEKIAEPLRERLPSATLIFAGDNDLEEKGERGQKAARRAARNAGGVVALPPIADTDWNDHAHGKPGVCEAQGLEDVRAPLTLAAGIVDLPPTVTLAEGAAQLKRIVGNFFDQAQAWHDVPEQQQRPTPPAHLANGTMGSGKSRMARAAAGRFLENNKGAAVHFALPLHRLNTEQAAAFKAETGQDVATWRGMEQPDPEREGAKMCLQPELSKAAQDAGASVSEICKVCPSRNDCGYRRQQQQKARAWYLPHQLIFHEKPKAIPKPAALVVEEAFHAAAQAENIRLAASTLEGDLSDVQHMGDRELLRELRGMLLAALKAAAAEASEKRARLTKAQLEAVGLTADQAQEARRIEWTRKPKPELSGDVPDMLRALKAMAGRFTPKVPHLWGLVEDLLRAEYDVSTGIELEPDATLQGGDGFGLLVRLNYRRDIHESWRAPTLMLDGTARPEIVRHFFPELHVAPEVHIEAPHQRVTWVRHSFAKSRLVASERASNGYNMARRNNVEDLRRFLEVKAAEFRGRGAEPYDGLVICNLAVEDLLRAGRGLPANIAVEHFNNLRGINAYESVRFVVVIGRPLPDARTIHRQAERLAGHPLDQGDPLVAAMRWSICEAELLQDIARARGIRRTEANPLDVFLLGDTALPLKIDRTTSWGQAQPHPLELLAARGVVPDCDTSAKGYWALVQAMLPDVFSDVQAAKDWARSSRWESSIGTILIDGFHRERWQAKPHGGRYSVPVLVDPERRRLDLAAVLDLAAISGGTAGLAAEKPALPSMPSILSPQGLPLRAELVPVITVEFLEALKGAGSVKNGLSAEYTPPLDNGAADPLADPALLPVAKQWPVAGPSAAVVDAGYSGPAASVVSTVRAPAPIVVPVANQAAAFPENGNPLSANTGKETEPASHLNGAAITVKTGLETETGRPIAKLANSSHSPPDHLAAYDGGIMPGPVRDLVRGRWRAARMTQNGLAQLAGISRPQLANALQGRFGLSSDAAARLRAAVASLPVVQQGLL